MLIPPHNCANESLFDDMFIQCSDCDFRPEPMLLRDTDGNVERLMNRILKLYAEKEPYYKDIIESLTDAILRYRQKNIQVKIKYPFIRDFRDVLYETLSKSDFDPGGAIAATRCGFADSFYFSTCFKSTRSLPLAYRKAKK
ncbi:MAG: hypothetical protein IJX80_03835 [Clostridia bacterium]|nr:hypothetical protein [Clostridia bacterium]